MQNPDNSSVHHAHSQEIKKDVSARDLFGDSVTDEQIEAAAGNLAGGADRYFKDVGASVAPSVCADHGC